jgi:predicted RNase H-like HicB family nuclease
MSMKYLVVVEKGESSWGAHVPDLPGCVAIGESKDEVLKLIKEAIELHLDDLKESAQPIPAPASDSAFIETDVA